MIPLSEISPIRNIYFSSSYAVLVWLQPYAYGVTVYHLKKEHWAKAVGWIAIIFLVPSFILARIFAWGLENDLYTPRTILMGVSAVVMAGQTVFWWLLWNEYHRRREINPWRTISVTAFISSLVLSFLSLTSFYVEKQYRYLEGVRVLHQTEIDNRHLSDVGYVQYPNATYPFGDCTIRSSHEDEVLAGYVSNRPGAYNESISVHFRTSDDPSQVINYYSGHVRLAGLTVRQGTSRISGQPVLIGTRSDRTAIIFEFLKIGGAASPGDWNITAYWDTPDGFQANLDRSFDLEGP